MDNLESSHSGEESENKQLEPLQLGQKQALAGVDERLRNLIAPAMGFRELRQMGRTLPTTPVQDLNTLLDTLSQFQSNLGAAIECLNKGDILPTITEGSPEEALDLKRTDYIERLNNLK